MTFRSPASKAGGCHPWARSSPAVPGHGGDRAPSPDVTTPGRVVLPTLTSVQAQHVGKVDRVTFGFTNGLPADVLLEWVDTLHHDGSGLPVRVAGTKVLAVVFTGRHAHDQNGSTIRARDGVRAAQRDHGGAVRVTSRARSPSVSACRSARRTPSRSCRTPTGSWSTSGRGSPRATRRVWFVDTDAVNTGTGPFFVPRQRPVRADAPAAAALHALFAGPLPQERAAGLRLVRSHAWGFDDLRITDRIARVRLTRGCNSNGSTITVAGEIAPTMRQFPTVDWVKIYGPGGHTEQPTGPVDSIPFCLEP